MAVKPLDNATYNIDFSPLWDYVLVEPLISNKTKGGVLLPDGKHVDDMAKGLVVKAGPGTYRDSGTWVANPLKVGDVIYHMAKMQPFKVVIEGKLYLCLAGRDVVATAPSMAEAVAAQTIAKL